MTSSLRRSPGQQAIPSANKRYRAASGRRTRASTINQSRGLQLRGARDGKLTFPGHACTPWRNCNSCAAECSDECLLCGKGWPPWHDRSSFLPARVRPQGGGRCSQVAVSALASRPSCWSSWLPAASQAARASGPLTRARLRMGRTAVVPQALTSRERDASRRGTVAPVCSASKVCVAPPRATSLAIIALPRGPGLRASAPQ